MDSAHHQLTVHIHIDHLRSPDEHRQYRPNCASTTSTAQSSLHRASTTPEALRTIKIRTNNANSLLSEHARVTLFLFAPQNAIKPPRLRIHDAPIVLLRPWQNTMRITHSPIRSSSATKSRFPQAHLASRMPHSPLQQRYIKSRSPRAHLAFSMHCSRLQQPHAEKPLSASAPRIQYALLPAAALRRIALAYYNRTRYGHNVDPSLANRIWT